MRKSLHHTVSLFCWAALLLTACGGDGELGDAHIGVSTSALSAADVASVTITVSGANISPDIVHKLHKSKGQWRGKIGNIPAGAGRVFTARAYSSASALVYEGATSGVTVARGKPVTVIIVLQQKTAPTPFANASPAISSLVVSTTKLGPSESATLAVTAADPDGDALTYAWTATGGTFSGANTATPSWTAPATAGSHTLTVTVSDGNGASVGLSVAADVQSHHARGSASLSTSFNTWPVVAQVSASPGHVAAGGSVSLSASASDAEGHTLSYAWSQGSCAGNFSSATAQSPTWTAPATAPSAGSCPLQVTVSDGNGGSSTGTVTVKVGDQATANVAPVVDSSYQSHQSVSGGETVTLRVVARDPEANALTFAWSASAGTVGAASTTAGVGTYTSENTLTVPTSCGSVLTVTVSIGDGVSNTNATFALGCAGRAGGASAESANDVARDASGNLYITGPFKGTATFGSTTLTSAGGDDLFVAKLTSGGTYAWAVQAGGSGDDVSRGLAVDSSGNVFVTGGFQSTATFGTTTLTSAGISDVFLCKLTSGGAFVWARRAGGSMDDSGMDVALDSAGDPHLTGYFQSTAIFGSYSLGSSGYSDVFWAKVTNGTGIFIWANGAGGTLTDIGRGIAVDSAGRSHVTGMFKNTITFGATTLTSAGDADVFVLKTSAGGVPGLAVRAGGASTAETHAIALDSAGNMYITGTFKGTSTFGSASLTSAGGKDLFVARLDLVGVFQWASRGGGTLDDHARDVAVDSAGNVYLTGSFQQTATLGSVSLSSTGGSDVFAARLDKSGAFASASQAGGSLDAAGLCLTVDGAGTVQVAGLFQGSADFGGAGLTSAGASDLFVWSVNP